MLSIEQLLSFLIAASIITLAPGPDNMMVLGIGILKGRLQGIMFGLGCAIGCLSHTLLAVLGISALIAGSPSAYMALKMCGGLYLGWLGFQSLRSTLNQFGSPSENGAVQTSAPLFIKGVMANAMNPKVILFFLSFLPQFVIPQQGNVATQIAQLGVIFTLQAALMFSLIGYFSGAIGQWIRVRPGAGTILNGLAGVMFIVLGIRLMLG